MVDRAVRSGDKHRVNAACFECFSQARAVLVPGSRHGGTPAGHFARYLIAALVWWSTTGKSDWAAQKHLFQLLPILL